jgi:thiamine pyrophosphate-dependent acetolactate synthase large subunit-like protein
VATLQRAHVLGIVDRAFPDQPVILTLGGTAREMIAVAGRRPNHLVNLDGMGQTVSLALGIALGLGKRLPGKVIAIEGDGSLLMGLSVLSTAGHLRARNLVVVLLDNGVYLATGGQPTAAADIDFVAVAAACGWSGRDVETDDELTAALAWAAEAGGPVLLRVQIGTDQIPTDFLLEDPAILAEDFRRWLASAVPNPKGETS